jgi:hypothetical protein
MGSIIMEGKVQKKKLAMSRQLEKMDKMKEQWAQSSCTATFRKNSYLAKMKGESNHDTLKTFFICHRSQRSGAVVKLSTSRRVDAR